MCFYHMGTLTATGLVFGGRFKRPFNQWNRKHDIILFYSKDHEAERPFNWESVLEEYSEITLSKFKYEDDEGVFRIRGHNIKGSPFRAQTNLAFETEIQLDS